MIVITGSEGFIGRNLVKELKCRGEDVFEIDPNRSFPDSNLEADKVTHIYHLGAISSTTETDVEKLYKHNIEFSVKLFEIAIDYSIPVSYASSAAVYGNGNGPINLYGTSKLTVDLWVQNNIDRFKLIRGYRFFNVYGEGEDNKIKVGQASPVSTFLHQAKTTGKINLFETHDGCRDFIWVGDVCRIMLEDDRESGIYDCGTREPQYFHMIAKWISEKTGAEIVKIPTPEHIKKNYQERSCAKETDGKCISVRDYISQLQ